LLHNRFSIPITFRLDAETVSGTRKSSNISPLGKKLGHIGNDSQKLKAYAREVMVE